VTNEEKWILTQSDYNTYEIARTGYNDGYSVNEWIALVKEEQAILMDTSHCSCFGTWCCGYGENECSLEGGTIRWQGTLKELLKMAKDKIDPDMPERIMSEGDCDYKDLMALYQEILFWNENRNK
jgi:hypothetical protein